MSERASNLIGGMSGLLAMLATQLGFVVAMRGTPGVGATDKQIVDFIGQPSASFYAGAFLELVGFVLFLVFAGRLCAILRRAETGDGWLSTTAFGGALAAMAVAIGGHISVHAGAFYAGGHGADPRTVATLLDLSGFAELSAGMLLAVFLGATALVVLRSGALPRWLGWFAAAIAVAFPPTLPFPNDLADLPIMLLVLWVVSTSVVLVRRRAATPVGAAAHAAA